MTLLPCLSACLFVCPLTGLYPFPDPPSVTRLLVPEEEGPGTVVAQGTLAQVEPGTFTQSPAQKANIRLSQCTSGYHPLPSQVSLNPTRLAVSHKRKTEQALKNSYVHTASQVLSTTQQKHLR